MTLRALLTLMFVFASPIPALAFGNCATAIYHNVFDDRISGSATCHQKELDSIRIGTTTSPVRVLRFDRDFDASDDVWISDLNDILAKVGRAATEMDASLRIEPVTIVMMNTEEYVDLSVEGAPPHTGPDQVHGVARWHSFVNECPVTMYKLDARITNPEFLQTVAHELFHCIQADTWPNKTYEPIGWWWVEGSAEYFGVLVVPEFLARHYADFGRNSQVAGLVEIGVPEALSYQNVAFFSWLHQEGGAASVGSFIRALPDDGAQQDVHALIDLPKWAAFTEALLGGEIRLPGGPVIPHGEPRQNLVIRADEGSTDWTAEAYRTLRIAVTANEPGRYEVGVSGTDALRARLRQGEGDWQDFPVEIDQCRNSAPAYLYAVTTQDLANFATNYRKTGDCSPCETAGVGDSCLAGTWTQTGGGAIEWMRANGMPADVQAESTEITFRLARDGDFIVNPVTTNIQGESDGMTVTGQGQSAGFAGHWGAAAGNLYICPISGETDVNVQAESEGNRETVYSKIFGPGDQVEVTYTCEGNTLTTSIPIPGLPPMETVYTRTEP